MRSRRPAGYLSGLISALLCCVLVASPAASALQGGGGARGTQAAGNLPTKGAPGKNLPDLDQVRRRGPARPKALPPVPSTLKKCPPDDPNCNAQADGAGARPAGAATPAAPSYAYRLLGALAAGLANPYEGVLLAANGPGIPAPPPSRIAPALSTRAADWLATSSSSRPARARAATTMTTARGWR